MSSNSAQLSGLSRQPLVSISQAKYQDVIDSERPKIPGRPSMSRAHRAAQFMPFAALVGYDDLVAETEDASTFAGNIVVPDTEQLEFADLEYIDSFPECEVDVFDNLEFLDSFDHSVDNTMNSFEIDEYCDNGMDNENLDNPTDDAL